MSDLQKSLDNMSMQDLITVKQIMEQEDFDSALQYQLMLDYMRVNKREMDKKRGNIIHMIDMSMNKAESEMWGEEKKEDPKITGKLGNFDGWDGIK